jgi:hypothetical protein
MSVLVVAEGRRELQRASQPCSQRQRVTLFELAMPIGMKVATIKISDLPPANAKAIPKEAAALVNRELPRDSYPTALV